MNYCETCKSSDNCELFGIIDFCINCIEFRSCDIKTEYCDEGHYIECNNGFELDDGYGE